MFVSHPTIDAVRTAHRILRNHEFYRDFKKSDLSVLKTPWNISLKYWHMIENHDEVRASPHPTTFANIRGMLLQHPPRGEGMRGSNPGVNKPLGATQ
jgi:hypothetical protein